LNRGIELQKLVAEFTSGVHFGLDTGEQVLAAFTSKRFNETCSQDAETRESRTELLGNTLPLRHESMNIHD
jgi:hypothetical protein